jgi:PAS domain S-box-containing protein
MTGKATGTPRRVLLDRVPEMVTISDRRGTIVYANPATERVFGYTPKEFAALDPFSRMHPEDRPRCEEAFAELMRTPGLILELEHRVRHKDGSWRWIEGTFASLFEDPEVGGSSPPSGTSAGASAPKKPCARARSATAPS